MSSSFCFGCSWTKWGSLVNLTIMAGYFYVLLLWAIAVSDFGSLEIFKNWGLPLFTIIFTVKSHADNHFHKYIYLLQVLYSMKYIFYIQIWFKCETPLWFFCNKNMVSRKIFCTEKNVFFADDVKIIELHVAHTWPHMQQEQWYL